MHVVVPEARSVAACLWLAEQTDLVVGASTGSALAGCLAWLEDHPEATHVACISPDFGANYRSTVYDAAWRAQLGFDQASPPDALIMPDEEETHV